MTIKLIIDGDNDVYWQSNNGMHNKFGPAFIWSSGSKSWWVNGFRHRLDGPAVEKNTGVKEWYINSVEYTYLEYLIALEEIDASKENI